MQNRLQVTCPHCSTALNVPRPNAPRGSTTCSKCAQSFVFNVPAPAPVAAPVAAPADPTFGDLPLNPLPQAPAAPQRSAQRRSSQQRFAQPSASHPPKQRSAMPIVLGIGAAVLIVIVGIGGWLVVRSDSVLPDAISDSIPGNLTGSLGVFDSAKSVVKDVDENDREIIRLVTEFGAAPDKEIAREQIADANKESRKLLLRAIRLSPLSESQAESLFPSDDGKTVPEGPIDDEARDKIVQQLKSLPREDLVGLQFTISRAATNSMFIREYLRFGHRKLPTAKTPGEKIAAEQIESKREVTLLVAKCLERAEKQFEKEFEKQQEAQADGVEPEKPDEKEIIARIEKIFGPITSDVQRIAKRLDELAVQRFEMEKSDVGDETQYTELDYYADQAQAHIFTGRFALRYDTPFVDAMKAYTTARLDVERAQDGLMPSRLREEELQQLAAEKQEKERLAKIAREQQAQQRKLKQEAAEQERLKQMAEAEIKRAEADAAGSTADTDQVADNAAGPRSGFPGRFPRPGFQGPSIPMGPRGSMGSRGPIGPSGASGRPGPGIPGSRNGSASRGFPRRPPFGPPEMEPIDTRTGVTITMKEAQGVDSRDVMMKLKPLDSRVQIHISNGNMTAKLSYTGSLDDVAKLIDFGKVVSKDPSKRTIVVEK